MWYPKKKSRPGGGATALGDSGWLGAGGGVEDSVKSFGTQYRRASLLTAGGQGGRTESRLCDGGQRIARPGDGRLHETRDLFEGLGGADRGRRRMRRGRRRAGGRAVERAPF